jgi:hypothetical protein
MANACSMSKTWLVIQARNSPRADDSDARSSPAVIHPPLPHNTHRRLVHWESTAAQLLQDIDMASVCRRGFARKDTLMPEETCAGADTGEQPPLPPPDTGAETTFNRLRFSSI